MFSDKAIRVALVDDHEHVHTAVKLVLQTVNDIRLVGQARRGNDVVELCRYARPDIVLMDVEMPGMSGVETTRLLRREFPDIKVLVLSSYSEYEYIRDMLSSGAIGYLVKTTIADDLVTTIRDTVRGNTVLSPDVARVVLDPPTASVSDDYGLTEREQQVLELIASGMTNAQVAAELSISQPTVRFHMNNILEKFEVETRSEALVFAAKVGLLG